MIFKQLFLSFLLFLCWYSSLNSFNHYFFFLSFFYFLIFSFLFILLLESLIFFASFKSQSDFSSLNFCSFFSIFSSFCFFYFPSFRLPVIHAAIFQELPHLHRFDSLLIFDSLTFFLSRWADLYFFILLQIESSIPKYSHKRTGISFWLFSTFEDIIFVFSHLLNNHI